MSIDQQHSGLAALSPVVVTDQAGTAPQQFSALARELRDALPGLVTDVQHIGGTSVPGLAGRPVIDLLLLTPRLEQFDQRGSALRRLGYLSLGDGGISNQRLFALGSGTACKATLYACEPGARSALHHLLLRDYLRTHRVERDDFSALKRQLAEQHLANAAGYAAGKRPRLSRLLEQATGRR